MNHIPLHLSNISWREMVAAIGWLFTMYLNLLWESGAIAQRHLSGWQINSPRFSFYKQMWNFIVHDWKYMEVWRSRISSVDRSSWVLSTLKTPDLNIFSSKRWKSHIYLITKKNVQNFMCQSDIVNIYFDYRVCKFL